MTVRTHDNEVRVVFNGLVQNLIHNGPLNVESENFLAVDRRLGAEFVESLMLLAEVAGDRGTHGQGSGFKANEVRFGFADVEQNEFRAMGAGHVPGCVEDACSNVGEIDGYENSFHRLLPSGSDLA